LERDEEGWHIYYPDWENIGASTWGYSQAEALCHIQEVLEMIIEEEGTPLPSMEEEEVPDGIPVSVTV